MAKTVTLKMKALREEVVSKIEELMKGGKTMQFEMKFDRQEGMSYKALLDSDPAKYISGKFFFNEEGKVIEGSAHDVSSDDHTVSTDGYPQRLYDIYDTAKLEVGNYEPSLMADFSDLVPTSEIRIYRKGDVGSLEFEITEEGGKFFVRLEETESGELLINRNIPYYSAKQAESALEAALELYA